MLNFLKSIYQTIFIKSKITWCNVFYDSYDDIEVVKEGLVQRSFKWQKNRGLKIFVISYVNNWEFTLLDNLEEYGEVYHFTWSRPVELYELKSDWYKNKVNINTRLREEFNDFYDEYSNILIFSYASDYTIDSKVLSSLKKENVLLSNFWWDDLLYYSKTYKGQTLGVKKISSVVDFNLSMSPEAMVQYRSNKSPCFFWNSIPDNVKLIDVDISNTVSSDFYVLFIGSRYGRRPGFIERLKKVGINVVCYGKGWETRHLSQVEMIDEIRKAPVTLGFANVGYTWSITTVKGRDFEVPLWGGLYLTQYSSGIEEYYEPNIDLFTYIDFDDCVKKIQFIFNNPELAMQVRRRGMIKALRSCTWESRFRYYFDLVEKLSY